MTSRSFSHLRDKVIIGLAIILSPVGFILLLVVLSLLSRCQAPNEPIVEGAFPLVERWHFGADGEIAAEPGAGSGKIVIRTRNTVYALDVRTGALLWDVSMPLSSILTPTPPLVEDDLVVIEYGAEAAALNATTGQLMWTSTITGCGEMDLLPAAASKTIIYVVRGGCGTQALNRATGTVIWDADLPGNRSGANLFLDQDKVYLVSTSGILQIRDSATGELVEEIKGQIGAPATYQSGILYGSKGEGELVAFDTRTKRVLWSRQGWHWEHSPSLNGQHVLVPTRHDAPVAFDAQTGRHLWTAKTDEDTYDTPIILSNTVYIRGMFAGKVYALAIEDGSELGYVFTGKQWVVTHPVMYWRPVTIDGLLIVPMGNRVYAYGN